MRGDVHVIIHDINGNPEKATLTNALYVPSYPQDIFSVQAATEKGACIIFQSDYAELKYDETEFNIEKDGRLSYLKTYDVKSESDSVNYTRDIKGWHAILGHCNYEDIIKLEGVVDGMKVSGKDSVKSGDCNTCILGKLPDSRNRKPDARAKAPLELVHTDPSGPIEPISRGGFRYSIAFTDDFSGAVAVYLLKNKSDAVRAAEKILADVAPYGTVKCIRSDEGSELISKEFGSFLSKNGIWHDKSCPNSPHQNNTAERHWRTLFEMGRCLLTQGNINKESWPYAVMAAAHIRNRCYNKRLQRTPYQAMTGRKPNLANMETFGSECFAYKQKRSKLDDRCVRFTDDGE